MEKSFTPIERIKNFNELKKIINRSSFEIEKGVKAVDLKMIKGMILQIRYRIDIEKMRCEEENVDKDEEAKRINEIIEEFSLINPSEVTNALDDVDPN